MVAQVGSDGTVPTSLVDDAATTRCASPSSPPRRHRPGPAHGRPDLRARHQPVAGPPRERRRRHARSSWPPSRPGGRAWSVPRHVLRPGPLPGSRRDPRLRRDLTVGEGCSGAAGSASPPTDRRSTGSSRHSTTASHASATSTYGGDPAVTAAGAVDGRPDTGWTSAPGDPAPTLPLSWGPRRVSASTSTPARASPGVRPTSWSSTAARGPASPSWSPRRPQRGQDAPGTHQPRVRSVPGESGPGRRRSPSCASTASRTSGTSPARSPTGTVCGFGPTIEVGGRRCRPG